MFDLSITKLLVLAVIAIVVFGPDQLPKIAAQAGRTLRELRRMADGAREDLREGLGPEFADFDIADLNPKHFVRKHLLDDFDPVTEGAELPIPDLGSEVTVPGGLAPGEEPPYDTEAT